MPYFDEDYVMLEDGYVYFWLPEKGAVAAHTLRQIADELDERNAAWDAIVKKEIGGEESVTVDRVPNLRRSSPDHPETGGGDQPPAPAAQQTKAQET